MKKSMPYGLFLIGLIALFYLGNENVAIGCLLMSIIMLIDRIWPCVKDE